MLCIICNLDECSCDSLSLAGKIQLFDQTFAKSFQINDNMYYPSYTSIDMHQFSYSSLKIYQSDVVFFTKVLVYLITHWPVTNKLMENHILNVCGAIASQMQRRGGSLLRKDVTSKITTQHIISKSTLRTVEAIFNGWKIANHTPFGFCFMDKINVDFPRQKWKAFEFVFWLPSELNEMIGEYAPVCECACSYLETSLNVIVGCDILECGEHLCCTCCAYLLCGDGVCEICKKTKYCKLCTIECANCLLNVSTECYRDCGMCEDAVICLHCCPMMSKQQPLCSRCMKLSQRKRSRFVH